MTPPFWRKHHFERRPRAAERPGQRDVQHGGPLLVGHLHQRHRPPEPRVVHGNVEAPEPRHRSVVQRAHLRLVPARRRRSACTRSGVGPTLRRVAPPSRRSRRSCASDSTTDAPSSRQRRAVAEPMPVPAAAVTMHDLALEERRGRPAAGRRRWLEGRVKARAHATPFGSGGRPSTRSPMMLRWIWFDPP